MLSRNIQLFEKLSDKIYFSITDLVSILDIKPESAKVLASRYTKKGIFFRLKKDFYVLAQNWQNYTNDQYLKIANLLQVPSYISFMTALNYYEVTTQVQRNFFESAAQKRTISFDIKGTIFIYYKLKRQLYFDFSRMDNIFISTKEKAFIDAIYLFSFGKYKIDFDSLDLTKLDKQIIKKIIKVYPEKTKKIVKGLCNI
jgi:predicted transcriptional regulator of viral defense system